MKPSRSDDKYWLGTKDFDHIQYERDLENYIIVLENKARMSASQRADDKERIFNNAVRHVQETHCNSHISPRWSSPFMLLGDVADLIKITTGKEVDWNVLAQTSDIPDDIVKKLRTNIKCITKTNKNERFF